MVPKRLGGVGASFADWAGKGRDAGGLGFGSGIVSLTLALIIAGLVSYLSFTHNDSLKV